MKKEKLPNHTTEELLSTIAQELPVQANMEWDEKLLFQQYTQEEHAIGHQTKHQQQTRERYLDKVIEYAPEGIMILDKLGYISYLNPAMSSLLHGKPEVYHGKAVVSILGIASKQKVSQFLAGAYAMQKPETFRDEVEFVVKGHAPVLAKLSINKMIYQGMVAFVCAATNLYDVQELKEKLHEKTERFEELKQLNMELDSFVYRVSHDLRSPIASSLGLIQLIEQEGSVEAIRQYVGLQKKSLQKLDYFIHEILAYSKSKRSALQLEEIDMRCLVQAIVSQHQAHGEQTPEVHIEVKNAVPVISDKLRLDIIMGNLISNAIRYADPRKPKQHIHVQVSSSSYETRVSVADNGIGIGKAHIDKIFQMFYRGTDRNNGSGLGLYIVKEALTSLKGDIRVESKEGVGTTFTLILPNSVGIH